MPSLTRLDGGEVLRLQGDPVEQGDQAGRRVAGQRDAQRGGAGGQALSRPGFT